MRLALLALLLACIGSQSTASDDQSAAPAVEAWSAAAPYTLAGATSMRHLGAKDGLERVVYLWLPERDAATMQRLPVVVVLDAEYAFPIAQSVIKHFVDRDDMPAMAVVGISYVDAARDINVYRRARTRDYTPTHSLAGGYGPEFQRLSGGGAAFRDTLIDEILPELARRHALDLQRATLVGHSYGGLFGAFVLATRPAAFQRYLLVSPSLWYDRRKIFELEAQRARDTTPIAARVFLAVGQSENPVMASDLTRYARRLESRGYADLAVQARVYRNENHNSVFPGAFSAGLRWLLQ